MEKMSHKLEIQGMQISTMITTIDSKFEEFTTLLDKELKELDDAVITMKSEISSRLNKIDKDISSAIT
jgi:hypothetical protein